MCRRIDEYISLQLFVLFVVVPNMLLEQSVIPLMIICYQFEIKRVLPAAKMNVPDK